MFSEDIVLRTEQLQAMSSADGVAALLLTLGYPVQRSAMTPEALGITAEGLRRHIRRVEQLAVLDDWLHVYLLEMRSMRVADRQAIARSLRNSAGDFLLILTSDYETLDFVLLERVQGEGRGEASQRQVGIRPRPLTVERKRPGAVALRVLRRFTCTEEDPFQQFEKLLSAYTVAEWAEPLFNNRALFSDYYLKERLPADPAWQDDPTGPYRRIQALMAAVRSRLSQADGEITRQELLQPLLTSLGFAPRRGQAVEGQEAEPDYRLYDTADDGTLLVTCLAYPWHRYLDGRDDRRDADRPTDNPGARVVSLLQEGSSPYVILTNGKLWRLYAAQTHSRATNYYEIDLEETLNSPEREVAFRYFWLFFRADAFRLEEALQADQPRSACFLDRMLEGSETYAKELRERLKDRVFDEIFPLFAEGFVEYIRQVEGGDASLDQKRLDLVYQSTLTFLYRLMFVLYAEALDLLPVKEVRGYWEVSMQRLKEEVAARGGPISDDSAERLAKAYRADATVLYDRLSQLFAVIDRGSLDCNVPRYNGGLFNTEPDAASDEQDAQIARFLRDCKIPDRYLAQGLDRLARDLDDKTHALVAVDFESLGVRQLGSIYEGLLEFKLRIAPARMAVVKGKRTEEIIPYAEAKRTKRTVLKLGRGANATERTLPKGTVYLENNRQERKATGSYYTPDYIVQYIVEQTVGPVLSEKLDALRPRLREAERAYRQHRNNAVAKSQAGGRFEDPEKYWNREDMLQLAFDVLDIKVLDPAMGSGHFLVEAVDFVTDRLLDFLNSFPYNPVQASLRRTREAILEAMEAQQVSVDPGRLNDVALLKRQVLKRCVYGVDLNPMAVELAKVSLWLDAFTLGAPLSFLDHHLRCGNSLIGAMAHEADEEMRRGDKQQLTFLEGPFVGLLRSAEIMRGIGMLADATMEQAQESATLFRQFERAARPYKQFLDVYVMRDFGVKRADEFLRVHGVEKMQASLKTLSPPYRQLLAEREAMYRDHRFFHWDLEFPEVFIDLGRSTWKQYPGFDGVVGNPPYLGFHRGSAAERAYYRSTFASAVGKYDQYIVFVEKALQLASISGREGMITPNRFLTTEYGQGLRHQMIELCKDVSILDFGDSEVFEDSTTYPSINFCTRKDVLESHPCRVRYIKSSAEEQSKGALPEPLEGRKVEREDFLQGRNLNVTMGVATILDALEGRVCTMRLGDMTTGIFQGIRTGEQSLYYVPLGVAESHGLEDCALRVALANSHVERYHILADEAGQFRLIYPYDLRAGEAISMSETKISNILAYLRQFKQRLAKRKNSGRSFEQTDLAWWEIWDPCPMWAQPRIVVPDISDHNRFALDAQGRFAPLNIIYSIVLDPEYRNIGYGALLALLNSKLIESFIRSVSRAQRGGYYRYQTRLMMQIPIPIKGIVDVQVAGNRLTTEVHNLYMNRDYEGVLRNLPLQPLPEGERSHHDLLTFLSERMMEMQQEKHAEAHHFLSESELYLGTSIDDLSGKTIIQNYLGDYQKDEPELPWDELLHRLQSNRSKIRANLSDPALLHRLREAYEASLATLLPIKQRLRETDWLIDQVVYKLYGLSDEEIAIVEGRG